jgi:hypothetical protein
MPSRSASPPVNEMPSEKSALQIILVDETGHSESYVYHPEHTGIVARLKRGLRQRANHYPGP